MRLNFYQESTHQAYLLWLHSTLAAWGYCALTVPVLTTRLAGEGVRWVIRFHTYSFTSLTWMHDAFYVSGVKVFPQALGHLLTPLALAVWIMDDGSVLPYGLKLATNNFTQEDNSLMAKLLNQTYGLDVRVHSAGVAGQWNLYITSASMPALRQLVLPHMHPSMLYKLHL